MSRRNLGIIIVAVGTLVAVVAATADIIGLGADSAANVFGNRQIIGVVAGAVAVVAGLVVTCLSGRPTEQVVRNETDIRP